MDRGGGGWGLQPPSPLKLEKNIIHELRETVMEGACKKKKLKKFSIWFDFQIKIRTLL